MARTYGIKIPKSLEQRLERAGERHLSVDLKSIVIWISGQVRHIIAYLRRGNRILEIISNYPMVMLGFIFFHTDLNAEFTQKLDRILSQYPVKWSL